MSISVLSFSELNNVSGANANSGFEPDYSRRSNSKGISYGGQANGFVGTQSHGLSLSELSEAHPCATGVIGGAISASLGGLASAAMGAVGGGIAGGCLNNNRSGNGNGGGTGSNSSNCSSGNDCSW